ncbi:hypothetical protein Hanom_Chr08g00727761 [Helianthus anomalus]
MVNASSLSEFVFCRLFTVLFKTSYDNFTYLTSNNNLSFILSSSLYFSSFSSNCLHGSKHFKHGLMT